MHSGDNRKLVCGIWPNRPPSSHRSNVEGSIIGTNLSLVNRQVGPPDLEHCLLSFHRLLGGGDTGRTRHESGVPLVGASWRPRRRKRHLNRQCCRAQHAWLVHRAGIRLQAHRVYDRERCRRPHRSSRRWLLGFKIRCSTRTLEGRRVMEGHRNMEYVG